MGECHHPPNVERRTSVEKVLLWAERELEKLGVVAIESQRAFCPSTALALFSVYASFSRL